MFLVATAGVCLNISSVVYFAQLKTQTAFHRYFKKTQTRVLNNFINIVNFSKASLYTLFYDPIFLNRLLLMLALTDTFHLVSSALTFSIANLSATYSSHAWYYIVPFSLPIAQVSILVQYLLTFQDLDADHDDCQRIPHDLPHSGEIHLRGEALLPPKEQVLPVLRDPGGPRPRVFSPVLPPQLLHAHHRPRDRPRPRDHRCQ